MAIRLMDAAPVKKKRSHLLDFMLVFIILCAIGGGVTVLAFGIDDYSQMRNMQLTWTEIKDIADSEDPKRPMTYLEVTQDDMAHGVILEGIKPKVKKVEETTDYLYRSINMDALKLINPDVSGYVYVPNTAVDYPILKEKTPGEYYYLDHNINKEYDRYGSIFELSDSERGGSRSAINIIFGHNMTSGAMFAGITNYKNPGYESNPVYVYRDGYRIEYRAFATCLMNAYDDLYDFDKYTTGSDEYGEFLEKIKSTSTIDFSMEFPDKYEGITVLSTCNDAHSDVRHVVFLREYRRAMVPEYYETLEEVKEYGGDEQGIEKPKPESETSDDNHDYRQEIGDYGAQGVVIS